jgi:hypothetical protein
LARFRIEGSGIDVAALEARVDAAIEAKRGTRFTDDELARLRDEPLRPRLRREDLPRGLMEELQQVRGRLPELPPAPVSTPEAAPARDRDEPPGSQRAAPDMAAVWASNRPGLAGKALGVVRRMARTVLRTTTNLEAVLVQQQDYAREMVAATERDIVGLEQRLERSFDVLKDHIDRTADRTADWAGAHMAATSGTLEERQERALHLSHNMVVELTNARLDLQQMQARLNEMARRMAELETRGRTLEALTLTPPSATDDT